MNVISMAVLERTIEIGILRALANNPALLLADEPTGNLDSVSGSEIVDLLRDLNKEGLTIVMVTHNPSATKYSNRVLKVKDGQLFE
jgi:putative ABC transport system ATP-binding protein